MSTPHPPERKFYFEGDALVDFPLRMFRTLIRLLLSIAIKRYRFGASRKVFVGTAFRVRQIWKSFENGAWIHFESMKMTAWVLELENLLALWVFVGTAVRVRQLCGSADLYRKSFANGG